MESTVRHAGGSTVASIAGAAVPVGRHVGLDTENRLDPRGAGGLVEFERGMQVAVIRDRHRGHAQFLDSIDQRSNTIPTVEQRVLAVEVEMGEPVSGSHVERFRPWCQSMVSPRFARSTGRPPIHGNKPQPAREIEDSGSYTALMSDRFTENGPSSSFTGFRANHVHVATVGRRMHQGWQRIDRGGPVKRFMTGLLVLVLAVPILLLAIFLILLMAAIGLASALVTFMLGGRSKVGRSPRDPDAQARENVRVIPPKS